MARTHKPMPKGQTYYRTEAKRLMRHVTQRQLEVMRQIAIGVYRNRDIAIALEISESTVHTHVTHLFQIFGLQNRVQLTLLALRLGEVPLFEPEDSDTGIAEEAG